MASLTTFAGANYTVPLIPAAHEPAFFTASTSTPIFAFNHNKQFCGYYSPSGGEFQSSATWNASWSTQGSSQNTWNMAMTTLAGPHGHHYVGVVPAYDTNSGSVYYAQGYQTGQNYLYGGTNSMCTGVWVNKTKRDNLCIQRANQTASYIYRTQIASLGYGALMAPLSATGDMTGATTAGTANGYNTNTSYGLVGYNETTKMWVVGQQVSGTSVQVFVYKNVPAPTMENASTYWSNFNHSTKISVTFTIPGSAAFDPYHWKIIPLDNGNIAIISKTQASAITYQLLTGNNGVDSTSWTASTLQSISITTSYHNQVWQDALPTFVSYDGKYVFVYTQYYYYASGMMGFLIRVSDGKRVTIQNATSSLAFSAVMIGASNMITSVSNNSDGGQGITLYEYDLGYLMDAYSDGSDVTSYYTTTYVDNPSASTTYPMIWTAVSPIPRFNKGVI